MPSLTGLGTRSTRPASVRRLAATGAAFAVACATWLLLLAPPAGAHAILSDSQPADGQEVDSAPTSLSFTFTERVDTGLAVIRLVGEGGQELSTGEPDAPRDPLILEVPLDTTLEEGVYSVTWRVVSEVDGHASAGIISFGVGVPAQAVPGVEAPEAIQSRASPLEIGSRWLLFAGLGLLVGASVVGSVAFRRAPAVTLRLAAGACVIAMVAIAGLALAQRSAADVPFGEFLGTAVGRAIVLRAVATTLALAAVVLALRSERARRPSLVIAATLGAAAMFAHVATGHAGADPEAATLQVVSQFVHVLAVSVWIGGLAALLLAVRGEPGDEKTRAAKRFSQAAGVALVMVIGTGVFRSIKEIGSWGDLFGTMYGRLVLIKIGLIAILAALGGVNRYRNLRKMPRSTQSLWAVGRVELVIAAAALLAAGTLAALVPPANVPAQAAQPTGAVATGSDFATSVRARLEASPGLPGPNTFRLRVSDYDSGEPIQADSVTLRFQPFGATGIAETSLPMDASDDGFSAGGPNLSTSGVWEVLAVIQSGGDSVEVPLQLATVCRTTEIEEEGRPTISLQDLPGGGTSQGYVSPAGGDRVEIHFTFLDDAGTELKLGQSSIVISGQGAEPSALETIPLTDGHFLAETSLGPGEWRFDGTASTSSGETVAGCFSASA